MTPSPSGALSPQCIDAEADAWLERLLPLSPGAWLEVDQTRLSAASRVGLSALITLDMVDEQAASNAICLTGSGRAYAARR